MKVYFIYVFLFGGCMSYIEPVTPYIYFFSYTTEKNHLCFRIEVDLI